VEHKNNKMETQDLFLVFGEKCQELKEAGHTPFFRYSGHVNFYNFDVYRGKYQKRKKVCISLSSYEFENIGAFLQECLNKSNLLMLGKL
jgi:hypothetical protein